MSAAMRRISESHAFQHVITGVIVFAGVLVGVETYPSFVARHEGIIHALDKIVLGIFIAELVIKMAAEGSRPWRYFRDGWNVFDFLIVASSLLPIGGQHLVVLRLARLLRVLRLLRALPKLQILVNALLKSIPSMGYVSLLLGLIFYMYGVAGTFLFGPNDPLHFGTLPMSLLTLFQVVTLEAWSDLLLIQMQGCDKYGYDAFAHLCTQPQAQPVAAVIYLVSFILLGTMIILNLFIGVIMNGMQEAHAEEDKRKREEGGAPSLEQELDAIEHQMDALKERLVNLRRSHLARTPLEAKPEAPVRKTG